jgi:hypothetical protein
MNRKGEACARKRRTKDFDSGEEIEWLRSIPMLVSHPALIASRPWSTRPSPPPMYTFLGEREDQRRLKR